jgi:hypothetical protein
MRKKADNYDLLSQKLKDQAPKLLEFKEAIDRLESST